MNIVFSEYGFVALTSIAAAFAFAIGAFVMYNYGGWEDVYIARLTGVTQQELVEAEQFYKN